MKSSEIMVKKTYLKGSNNEFYQVVQIIYVMDKEYLENTAVRLSKMPTKTDYQAKINRNEVEAITGALKSGKETFVLKHQLDKKDVDKEKELGKIQDLIKEAGLTIPD